MKCPNCGHGIRITKKHKELALNPCLCCQKAEKNVSIKGTSSKYCKECGKYIRQVIYKHLDNNTFAVHRRYRGILLQMIKYIKNDDFVINKKLKKELEGLKE